MTVDVTVTPEPDETPDTVVVEDSGPDVFVVNPPTDEPDNTDAVAALAIQVGELVGIVTSLQQQVSQSQATADHAVDVAEEAVEVAVEEEVIEEVEPDEPPAKVHMVHRSRHELFGRHD